MTLFIRTYSMTFRGQNIARRTMQYTWWDRLKSVFTGRELPEVIYGNVATHTVRIQGAATPFMDAEAKHRERFLLRRYRKIDPMAEHRFTVLLCEGHNMTERPLRDCSTGQSETYQRWLAGFSTSYSGTIIEDRINSECSI